MAALPTVYNYYTAGGITAGLSAAQNYFTLNNKNITLHSGALHYYRVPQQYWRDRLRKMRAAGLNTVETYVPWNLHEPEIGTYDFGNGGSDMQEFLNLETFLKTAQEEDLLAIVRPGPYICAEWEFGGFPSWLLREKDQEVRTSNPSFMKHVTRYFNVLLPILAAFQFTLGGPIISFQVENEYGALKLWPVFDTDKVYLEQLRQLFLKNGIVELLVTSDNAILHGIGGTLTEHFLHTANFADSADEQFDRLNELQPNKPTMAMEFWTGWYDHWGATHNVRSNEQFERVLDSILKYPASVNMYMFHGGTSFGFLNGANQLVSLGDTNFMYAPQTTSYDYDAPLSERGDYTEKYHIAKRLISKYSKVQFKTPEMPKVTPTTAYTNITITEQLRFEQVAELVSEKFNYASPVAMEMLPINNGSGQSYGYIVYKKTGLDIPANSELKISGYVWDSVIVLIDGKLVSKQLTGPHDLNGFGYWRLENGKLNLGGMNRTNATLELVVENWGRNNFGFSYQFKQFKGLWQCDVYINSDVISNWEVMPLQFKRKWTNSLSGWQSPDFSIVGPSLYKATFTVDNPEDTFLDMRAWTKGIVMINGFVLGRYVTPLGPQQTLYLPAPLQNKGVNEIVVFEQFTPSSQITFSEKPIYHTPRDVIKSKM
ncbi:beta-galactosidase-1-like protein 3 [Photinus pyralis]|nr:beta-galactosidase-1-like protein 3 [Photinus pyralis]